MATRPSGPRSVTDRLDALRFELKADIASSEIRLTEKIGALSDSVNAKVGALSDTLNARIDALGDSLNARIDALGDSLNARIDALGDSLNARIDALSARVDGVVRDLAELKGTIKGGAIAVSTLVPVMTALAVLAVNLAARKLGLP